MIWVQKSEPQHLLSIYFSTKFAQNRRFFQSLLVKNMLYNSRNQLVISRPDKENYWSYFFINFAAELLIS